MSVIIKYFNVLKSFYNQYFIQITCSVCFVRVILSPLETINFLIPSSIYCLYTKNYKNIFIIWGFFFFSWYLVFTLLLINYDKSIIVGGEHTGYLFNYFFDTYGDYEFIFRFWTCTVVVLDMISYYSGSPIYVPSVFKGILAVIKFIFGGKGSAECSPKNNSEKSSTPKTSSYPSPGTSPTGVNPTDPFFSSKFKEDPVKKGKISDKGATMYAQCEMLQKAMKSNQKWDDYFSISKEDYKGGTLAVYEVRVPLINFVLYEGCHRERFKRK